MSTDDTKLTVRIVSGRKTTLTKSNKGSPNETNETGTFSPIAVIDRNTTTKEKNTLSIVTTSTEEVEKKVTQKDKERKRFPTSFFYISCILIAVIIILAGALGGTLGKTSSDTTSVATVSIPSQETIVTVMMDPTVCDTPPCMEFNLTAITLIRCRLINETKMNYPDVTLASWVESNGTIIIIDANHSLNQGDCSTVSTYARRRLGAAVFGEEPVNPIAANFSVTVPPTTTNTASVAYKACMANIRFTYQE